MQSVAIPIYFNRHYSTKFSPKLNGLGTSIWQLPDVFQPKNASRFFGQLVSEFLRKNGLKIKCEIASK